MTDLARAGTTAATDVDLGALIDPEPLVSRSGNWTRWAGPLVSLLILGAVVYQLRSLPLGRTLAMVPSSPLFWLAFLGYYLALPLSEWVIFRRLWDFPLAGFPALLRKLVSNEILLGYLGEVYFYAWARRHAKVAAAPFGAIKDVSILSALTGNASTLLMVILAAPFLGALRVGPGGRLFLLSLAFLLVTSAVVMLMRRKLFTLPRAELRFVALVHLARIFGMIGLGAMMWHLLLPAVGLISWVLLATLRQLISRLPFIPNKEMVFAASAAVLVGRDAPVVAAMALIAGLVFAAHLLVGGLLGATDLLDACREEAA